MFKNYLKIAYRNLLNNKVFSLINIVGLSIGLTATILILLWVHYESTYDAFHKNADDIYMMAIEWPVGENTRKALSTPPTLAAAMKQDFPEIKNATRFNSRIEGQIKVESGIYKNILAFADPAFFEIFDFPLLEGSLASFKNSADNVLITKKIAHKFFGDIDPLGKSLKIDNKHIFTVTGILKDIPDNSNFNNDIFLPFDKIAEINNREDLTNWGSFRHRTLVQFQKDADIEKFGSEIYDYITKHSDNNEDKFFVWPLHNLHLHKVNGGGKYIYVYIFSAVALLILILAGINFMNLSTARSSLRSREIGLRKISGAKRIHIILQFYLESIFLALLSLCLSVALVEVLLPAFNNITGTHISFDIGNPIVLLLLLGITLLTGILAGSYPALFLSSFQPVNALKGSTRSGSSLFRKILVVSQFAISIALIISLLVISSQISFMNDKELGFEDENVVIFPFNNQLIEQRDTFYSELQHYPGIESVCASASEFGVNAPVSTLDVDWEGNESKRRLEMNLLATDPGFINTFQIEMIKGGFLTEDSNLEVAQLVLNETAVNRMGLEDPIGKEMQFFGNKCIIVGVIKDYHFDSLYEEVEPLMLFEAKDWHKFVAVRYNSKDRAGALEHLEEVYKKSSPDFPFEIEYLSVMTAKRYKTEKQAKTLFQYFVIIALFISSLGLFGLASFMTDRRTKEIGVRKVLGSSVKEIVWLLTSDFSKWVLIANIIAWPLAWFSMNKWLQNFAYRTEISLLYFVFAGSLTLAIALFSISFQTIKAANSNPVEALKYE